jgi:uncharacterized membrane protein YhaH (DUF805 family)
VLYLAALACLIVLLVRRSTPGPNRFGGFGGDAGRLHPTSPGETRMRNSVVRGLGNIFLFSGRDTRSEFWTYTAAVMALYALIALAAAQVLLANRNQIFPAFLTYFFPANLLVFAAVIALLAAAVSRRLHDSGLSALWGLLPLPFAIYSCAMFVLLSSQFSSGQPNSQNFDWVFYSGFASTALYQVALILLIVLLARRSAPDPKQKTEYSGKEAIDFAKRNFRETGRSGGGWLIHYEDPKTGEKWILDWPDGWLQGGGEARLRKVS